jgi:hypothetical protein
MMRLGRFALILAASLIAGATLFLGFDRPGDAWIRERRVMRFAPDLDPDFARHVATDSAPEWAEYCNRFGTGPLGVVLQKLENPLRTGNLGEFLERRVVLEQAALRVGEGFSQVYDFHAVERRIRHDMSHSPIEDFQTHVGAKRYIEINSDTRLNAGERNRVLDSLAAGFSAEGDSDYAVYASLQAISNELELGRSDRARARLESVLQSARQSRNYYVVCQLLGQLGVIHWFAGHSDSMRVCFDEGIAIAGTHRLIEQATRFLRFYSIYYANHGRLVTALDRLAAAERLCEEPGGETARLPVQMEYTYSALDWGCWDLAERELLRLPPMLREASRTNAEAEIDKFRFDAGLLRARLAFATGQADEGSRLMAETARIVPNADRRVGYADLLEQWSEGLAKSNRAREALAICDRGLAHCDSTHVPELELPLRLLRAEVLDCLGRNKAAEKALAQTRPGLSNTNSELLSRWAGIIEARMLLHRGRFEPAKRRIEQVFAAFRRQLLDREDGVMSYLELDDTRSLRDAVHEIECVTPEAGYRFELNWRSLAREIGGLHPDATGAAIGPAPSSSRTLRSLDGTHIVYWFSSDRLLRWTARGRRVVVDTLQLSAEHCLLEVREALELLQQETPPLHQVLGPKALDRLRLLGAQLLPRDLAAPGGQAARLYVSPDGPLDALPFEALVASGPNGQQPLALWADVAYVSGWSSVARRSRGREVIVSNPELSREFVQRYGFAGSLAGSQIESQAAVARWPDAILLAGRHATKDSIRATWPGASIIYLAAHHFRNPDAPFLGFVPLAAPAGAPPEEALLEIADVRAMDLSACRLAVLASCSSGAPYRSAVHPGPSLSDAFLDSGAAAVIRSSWDVGDAETREFMQTFLAGWRDEDDVAASLSRARRQVMASPEGASPRVWAAWSVETGWPLTAAVW